MSRWRPYRILNNLALLCLDVAIAIAVLKYRLYEIDQISPGRWLHRQDTSS